MSSLCLSVTLWAHTSDQPLCAANTFNLWTDCLPPVQDGHKIFRPMPLTTESVSRRQKPSRTFSLAFSVKEVVPRCAVEGFHNDPLWVGRITRTSFTPSQFQADLIVRCAW